VVKVSAFLSSIDLFPGFNATYERIFATEPRPARTTTGAELRDILVEIDAVLSLENELVDVRSRFRPRSTDRPCAGSTRANHFTKGEAGR